MQLKYNYIIEYRTWIIIINGDMWEFELIHSILHKTELFYKNWLYTYQSHSLNVSMHSKR